MGYDPEKKFLESFLIDTCELLVQTDGGVDPITGIPNITYTNVTNTGGVVTLIPCRKEPAVSHNRDTDKKSVRNNQTVFATHQIWLREDIDVTESANVVFNINNDGKNYDILFVETYPDMPGRNTKGLVVAERRNNG